MKGLVYNGPGNIAVEDVPRPKLVHQTDAIIRIDFTTICGSDLHIIKGDVPEVKPGTVLGHEGVGTILDVGTAVSNFQPGDQVLLSCISSCGTCEYCRRGMNSHCTTGGWLLGHTENGTQAECVRVPHADSSLFKIPEGVDPKTLVMLSDIFPTAYECGVLNGKVQPGSTVVIVGAGPVGLAALLTAQLYSPLWVLVIDPDPNRLKIARQLGAHHIAEPVVARKVVEELTHGKGCDTVIEAVGVPQSFEECQYLVAPGGVIANIGVHGTKVDLHLEKIWASNITITTGLVDTTTTSKLLQLVAAKKLPVERLMTHEFKSSEILKAYSTFQEAGSNKALKVLIKV